MKRKQKYRQGNPTVFLYDSLYCGFKEELLEKSASMCIDADSAIQQGFCYKRAEIYLDWCFEVPSFISHILRKKMNIILNLSIVRNCTFPFLNFAIEKGKYPLWYFCNILSSSLEEEKSYILWYGRHMHRESQEHKGEYGKGLVLSKII